MEMRGSVRGLGTTQCSPADSDPALIKNLSECRDRYIAQSILTGIVDKPELPTIEQAHDIMRWASRRCA